MKHSRVVLAILLAPTILFAEICKIIDSKHLGSSKIKELTTQFVSSELERLKGKGAWSQKSLAHLFEVMNLPIFAETCSSEAIKTINTKPDHKESFKECRNILTKTLPSLLEQEIKNKQYVVKCKGIKVQQISPLLGSNWSQVTCPIEAVYPKNLSYDQRPNPVSELIAKNANKKFLNKNSGLAQTPEYIGSFLTHGVATAALAKVALFSHQDTIGTLLFSRITDSEWGTPKAQVGVHNKWCSWNDYDYIYTCSSMEKLANQDNSKLMDLIDHGSKAGAVGLSQQKLDCYHPTSFGYDLKTAQKYGLATPNKENPKYDLIGSGDNFVGFAIPGTDYSLDPSSEDFN